jgi:O-methyltransferase
VGVLGTDSAERAATLYIDLLKRSVLGQTFIDQDLRISYLRKCLRGDAIYDERVLYAVDAHFGAERDRRSAQVEAGFPPGTDLTELPFCYTMLGRKRLDNVEHCVRTVLREGVPGDLMECGVWRGGSVVFMRGLLAAFGVTDRTVWVADSFEGLPVPEQAPDLALKMDLSRERFPALAVSEGDVRRAFASHGLLDDRVRFLKGWFKDTLPEAPVERLALLRADGDLYSSTLDVLESMYDRVVPGGFVVVDDYFLPNCRQAVDEFIVKRRILDPIERIDWTGIYWRKS